MTQRVLKRQSGPSLLKLGVGLGIAAVVTVMVFPLLAVLIKYGTLALGVVLGATLISRMFRGPKAQLPPRDEVVLAEPAVTIDEIAASYRDDDRASRAALDLELAKAVREAETKRE